ncbi:unnamed protein product [Sphenostylis stenocarpa]|uniref:Uncharacterized protein n=1 Tax=Sphenostylis stenocarpa TaxID=92480 RepID=A0AA86S2T9_9FABA|nr:unnamed protein product [Sphenostylis stenocarpa]
MCGGAIIASFVPSGPGECPCTLQNHDSLLRFVLRTQITPRCFNFTQLNPCSYLFSIYSAQDQQGTGWSLNTKRSPERPNKKRKNHWNNSGKRKMCDCNVNLEDNLEYCWPSLTKCLDEEDSDEASYSSSDSESYSGPSGLSFSVSKE